MLTNTKLYLRNRLLLQKQTVADFSFLNYPGVFVE